MSVPPLIVDSNERGPLCEAVHRMASKEGVLVKPQFLNGMGDYKVGAGHVSARVLAISSNQVTAVIFGDNSITSTPTATECSWLYMVT